MANSNLFIYLLLPVTFIASLPFHYYFSPHADVINNSPTLQWLNIVMVNDGLLWFIALYSIFGIYNKANLKLYAMQFVSILALSFFLYVWWFGQSIFDRINIATGGHCDDPRFSTIKSCVSNKHIWIHGFDCSGHYYILSIYITIILQHIYRLWELTRDGANFQFDKLSTYERALFIVSSVILALWYFEFIITAVFFHTTGEKVVGMLLGYIVPLVYIDV